MRAVIQRVKQAEVEVAEQIVSRIGHGILTFLGIAQGDDKNKIKKVVQKICELRIFEDDAGKMNLSLMDVKGSHLIVSQFTLMGDCSSGRRPSFLDAERPEFAQPLYEYALAYSREMGVVTEGGVFQADMKVSLLNDGPATFVIEV